ncbi:unnamed protein product [Leptidea sinapis]|uniref:Alpha-tubulin N-acetyltransferase n=1 Tax=Leptidea sinapis TaxID=189913 RepID=A0A5E4QGJ6_9NEOP|nr:unnamed protein product [Leptidea sinapis]
MDAFMISVNEVLHDEISVVTNTLRLPHFPADHKKASYFSKCLTKIIDDIGEMSSKAQNIGATLTTANKLQNSQHTLYLLKEAAANGGKGEVIGLLRVGSRHLYLYDDQKGKTWEGSPLCIFDFYIMENRQHCGFGKMLLDFMMKDKNIKTPQEFAIDAPSKKLQQFLHKYFACNLIPQGNNYCVLPGFFETQRRNTPDSPTSRSPVSPAHTSSVPPTTTVRVSQFGRYSAVKPKCTISTIIHGSPSIRQTTWLPVPSEVNPLNTSMMSV